MPMKVATVNAARVPATQTNFPAYVDLSRVGITTLAQAQSVRVYADSARLTEWAREIVSVTEMHVKIPSLTSTTSIYVDWDGVRADYAATDTFGRNAVWSDYLAVWHLNETSGSRSDSTSAGHTLTDNNTVLSATGKMGTCADFEQTNQEWLSKAAPSSFGGMGSVTFTGWANFESISRSHRMMGTWENTNGWLFMVETDNKLTTYIDTAGGIVSAKATSTFTTATWYHVVGRYNGSNIQNFIDGASNGSATSQTGTVTIGTSNFGIGDFPFTNTGQQTDGLLDEMRIFNGAMSDNRILTEYNNQGNESDFWGTWTDVVTAQRSAVLAYF